MVEDISASDRWVIPASVLQRIPGCAGGEAPLSVQLLHGGRNVNCNLRIDTRVGRFVLRQRIREGPRPGADPLREVACHRAAAAAAVAPAVLDAAPDGSWILMDYVEGGMWTPPRLQAPEGLRALGACLQRLHAITPPRDPQAFALCTFPRKRCAVITLRIPDTGREFGSRHRRCGCGPTPPR
jgi:aminoglycoside phosphotransferase (APT) family kinase protein